MTGNVTEIGMFADTGGSRIGNRRCLPGQDLDSAIAMAGHGVVTAAHDGQLVGDARLTREQLTDVHSRNARRDRTVDTAILRRCVGLQVVRF